MALGCNAKAMSTGSASAGRADAANSAGANSARWPACKQAGLRTCVKRDGRKFWQA